MNKRPSIKEAIALVSNLATHYKMEEAIILLEHYKELVSNNNEFLAARMLVDTVQDYYASVSTLKVANV